MLKVRKAILKSIAETERVISALNKESCELMYADVTEDEYQWRNECLKAEARSAEEVLWNLRAALAHIPA